MSPRAGVMSLICAIEPIPTFSTAARAIATTFTA